MYIFKKWCTSIININLNLVPNRVEMKVSHYTFSNFKRIGWVKIKWMRSGLGGRGWMFGQE